jgi:hypothetical protein
MGYSVGHWDGDTLVVESFGFNDRTCLVGGYPHTEKLRMTERFRRTDFGHMELAVTFQDPGAFSKAWTVPVRAQLAGDTELIESVYNEIPTMGKSTGSAMPPTQRERRPHFAKVRRRDQLAHGGALFCHRNPQEDGSFLRTIRAGVGVARQTRQRA